MKKIPDNKRHINAGKKKEEEVFKTIGENIFRLRGTMSQVKLAKKAGISKSTIWSIEKGRSISLESLFKIADALGVDPEDLFMSNKDRNEMSYKTKKIVQRIADLLGIEDENKE